MYIHVVLLVSKWTLLNEEVHAAYLEYSKVKRSPSCCILFVNVDDSLPQDVPVANTLITYTQMDVRLTIFIVRLIRFSSVKDIDLV